MDAYDIAEKIKERWAGLYPKNSGELKKLNKKIRVAVYQPGEGYKDVVGVIVSDDFIELLLEEDK